MLTHGVGNLFPLLHRQSQQSTSHHHFHFTCPSSTFLPRYLYQKDELTLSRNFRAETFLTTPPVVTMSVLPFNAPPPFTPFISPSPPSLRYIQQSIPHPKTNNIVHLQTLHFSSTAPTFTRLHSFTISRAETQTVISKWRNISTMQIWCLSNKLHPRWNLWAGATVHYQTWPCILDTCCESCVAWETTGIVKVAVNMLCRLHIQCYLLQAYIFWR